MRKTLALFVAVLCFSTIGCTQNKTKNPNILYIKANKMDEQEFWGIIDYSFSVSNGDLIEQEQIITTKLTAYTPQQIIDFETILRRLLLEANDYKVMAAQKIIEGSVSDDSFLYFRFWLIGQGRQTFKQSVKNPDYLSTIVSKGVDTDFESLLYVSTKAYKSKVGKTVEDDTFPRNVKVNQDLDYDFGNHKVSGKERNGKKMSFQCFIQNFGINLINKIIEIVVGGELCTK